MNKEKREQIQKNKTLEVAEVMKTTLGTDNVVTVNLKQKRLPRSPDFVMVFQEVGKRVLEGNMALSTCKVFYYLIMNMSFENFIGIDQKTISENIKMPLRTVSLAMKELKEAGMLMSIQNNLDRRRQDYRLNPIIGWKGKGTSRIKMLKEINPNQLKLYGIEE